MGTGADTGAEAGRAKSVLMVTPAHFKNYYETEHEDIAVTVGRRIFDHTSREVGLLLIDVNPESWWK